MPFNPLRTATIRNATYCSDAGGVGYEVVWNENNNFKQYDEFNGTAAEVVWNQTYVLASISGSCSIGPSEDQTPVDASKYDVVSIRYRIEQPTGAGITPSTGRIQFQTQDDATYDSTKQVDFTVYPDNAYHNYEIDLTQEKEWVGNITRVRIYPFIDGQAGTKVYLKSFTIKASQPLSCGHDEGSGGSCQGITISDGITITKGVDDELLININDYGEQKILLAPITGARIIDIARDIENKLSNIGIGGYYGAKVTAESNRLTIIADDTREENSTVVVSDTPAARKLGFYDSSGNSVSINNSGSDPSPNYSPASSIKLSKADISHLFDVDPNIKKSGILINPGKYVVEGGREDFDLTYRDKKIDFTNKTIIDFNNPISSTGRLTYFAYTGDGHKNTELRIFRPKADGSVEYVTFVDMGIAADNTTEKVFEKEIDLKVRKGDFLGIYNGKLDGGKQEELLNMSYYLYDGNLKDTLSSPEIKGRGDRGLRLYAHGDQLAEEVVLDVEFEEPQVIEEITVNAAEEIEEEVINLTQVRGSGPNNGPLVSTSTGLDKNGDQAPPMEDVSALTDGIKRELTDSTPVTYPSWLDDDFLPLDLYDQTPFNIDFDFAKGVPVFFNIFKVILYFRDPNNIKYFGIQYPATTDTLDENKNWVFFPEYSKVQLEGRDLTPSDHPLYSNPIHPTVSNYIDSYQVLRYRTLSLEFGPVKARSLRYVVDNLYFEDDTTSSSLSNFKLAPSPYIYEIEVYATSTPENSISDNFSFDSSLDGEKFYTHTTVEDIDADSANYLIGYPVRNLRIHIKPNNTVDLKSIDVSFSETKTKFSSGVKDNQVVINAALDDHNSLQEIEIHNDSSEKFHYYIDIASEQSESDRLILWSTLKDEDSVKKSNIGPGGHYNKREGYYLREYNYAYQAPAYVLNPVWLLNKKSYVTYDTGQTYEELGNLLTNYHDGTFVTARSSLYETHDKVFALIDLGDVYSLDTVQFSTPTQHLSFFNLTYSSKDVDSPSSLDINSDFVSTKSLVRWIKLSGDAVPTSEDDADTPGLSYVRASLDPLSPTNNRKIPWISTDLLTDFSFGFSASNNCGEGWACAIDGFNNYYCVDLQDRYDISNLLVGPASDSLGTVADIDLILPGGAASFFTSSEKKNSKVSFSGSQVSDPNKVKWSSLGEQVSGADRWILLKAVNSIYDEVAVHIEDNVQEDKPSFYVPRWWDSIFATPQKDKFEYVDPPSSVSFNYPADTGPSPETLLLEQSFGIDHELAAGDSLHFNFYLSDITQMDTSKGYFSIGRNTTEDNAGFTPLDGVSRDETNYYRWDHSDLEPPLKSGWNSVSLRFSDSYRVGQPFFTREDLANRHHTKDSGKSRFRWFEVVYAGIENNEDFTVKLNGFDIQRGTFLPSRFSNGLYITGNEYLKYPLENVNVFKGCIEFWLTPDWSRRENCNSCDLPVDHTIFRLFNRDGYNISLFMTGQGLRGYLTDGNNRHFYITDNNYQREIAANNNHHIAVSWDILGEESDSAVSIYIDNKLSSEITVPEITGASFSPNSFATLVFGAIAWGGLMNDIASSVDGIISDLKVYNYPKRDFSDSISATEAKQFLDTQHLIEISLDGVNFYSVNDRGTSMPLLKKDVEPDEKFKVYIRNKDNGESSIKNRIAHLQVKRLKV